MQMLAKHADRKVGAFELRSGGPAPLVPRGRETTSWMVVVQVGHLHDKTQTRNRLYTARRQPDATPTSRPRVRSRTTQGWRVAILLGGSGGGLVHGGDGMAA
jgi:hypothetical protein